MGYTPLTIEELRAFLDDENVDERELRIWNELGRIIYEHRMWRRRTALVNGRGRRVRPHWRNHLRSLL